MVDSHVSSKTEPSSVVTSAAYLLFYRRRSDPEHPLGGARLQEALREADNNDTTADSETAQDSRDSSPMTGEGRRLGDSSHNGLSSALQVGHGRRVGAGPGGSGLEEGNQRTRGLLAATDSPPSLTLGPAASSGGEQDQDFPPGYDASAMDDSMIDEGVADVGNVYHRWQVHTQPWSFQNLPSTQRAPANSEDEMFGDNRSSNDSTRVEGGEASPQPSLGSDLGDEGSIHHNPDDGDSGVYSSQTMPILHHEDFMHGRGTRESAPPPDEVPSGIAMSGRGMSLPVNMSVDDDDADVDDPPVMELQADPANNDELRFNPAA